MTQLFDVQTLLQAALAANPASLPGAFIDNQPLEGTGEVIWIRNPANGQITAQLSAASNAQVRQAIDAARKALAAWKSRSVAERCLFLDRIADGLEAEREALVALQQLSNGKPLSEAQIDVSDTIATFRYYASLRDWALFESEPLAVPEPDIEAVRHYEAAGVAGLILPWNFPMVTAAWKMAPALAAGCTVVVKPSELTPLPELALASVIQRAGLPPGVANWIFGARSVGQELSCAPDIEKISFTGSTVTGRTVAHAAAERIGRVTLELGGKSPLIVCDSADLHQAVDLAVAGIFANAGQMCSATSRILVHRRLHRQFCELLVAAAETLQPVGDDDAGQGQYGPLISAGQRDKVVTAIAVAVRDGLNLATGGSIPETQRDGYFLQPTVFCDVPSHHPLWKDEVFGPVACVNAFSDDAEAVQMANDTEYGLAATVITKSAEQAAWFEQRLRAGIVWTNLPQFVFPGVGWGGFGKSGVGRELGVLGLRAFQEAKHVLKRI